MYAGAEYSPARTSLEVSYLAGVLSSRAPGRRVLELGSGLGRHSAGLVSRGFSVTGLDVSSYAVSRAAASAPGAAFAVADLVRDRAWPVSGPFDAVVCVQAFGWGTDEENLAMLRRARSLLAPGGVLVLDHSNVSSILRAYLPESHASVADFSFHFMRTYDAVTGRSGGELRVRRPDGSAAVYADDVRLYTPAEVRSLLVLAGFSVVGADAEFTAGSPVTPASRYVQFTAVAPASVRPALAGHARSVPAGAVDLRWAVDEIEYVRPAVRAAWSAAVDPAETSRRYDVADPYSSVRSGPAVRSAFGVASGEVFAGAGTTGLLRALAGLAVGAEVAAEPVGHPELPLAAAALGVRVALGPLRASNGVVVLDRPGVLGSVESLASVADLAASVAERGGLLVVDETCANYLPASESAAPLVNQVPGLVVLRGVSKGWCCGGLRVGWAVCSPSAAARVREVLHPLPVAALSVDVALRLIADDAGLDPLRSRIASVRPWLVSVLSSLGVSVLPGDPRLPWVLVSASADEVLLAAGLVGKPVPAASGPDLLRLSVPLSVERVRAVAAASGLAEVPA